MSDYLQLAIKAAIAGCNAILQEKKKAITVTEKSDHSPVTNADLASSKAIEDLLEPSGSPILGEESEMVPYEKRKHWTDCWIVDPLDGTKDFVAGGNEYAVNIAWIEGGVPQIGVIAIPEQGVIYFGEKNEVHVGRFDGSELLGKELLPPIAEVEIRTYVISKSRLSPRLKDYLMRQQKEHLHVRVEPVGSAHKFCRMLEGKATVYPRFSPCMEWDIASGHALLRAQGKNIIQTENGKPMKYNKEDLYVPNFVAE